MMVLLFPPLQLHCATLNKPFEALARQKLQEVGHSGMRLWVQRTIDEK
jgi:hypothetical protein